MRRVLAVVALLTLATLATPVHGQDPTPGADTWVDADWTVTGQRLDLFDVDGALRVHEAVVDGQHLTADGIRDRHRQAKAQGEGEAFEDEIESAVRTEVRDALARFFPGAEVRINRVELRDDSLSATAGGSPYHPTVDVDVAARVDTVLPGGLPENRTRQRAVDALRMGAATRLDIGVEAEPGANHSVTLHLPPSVRALEGVQTPVRVDLDNWQGSRLAAETLRVNVTGANATRFEEADGDVTVRVDLHDVALDPLSGQGTVQASIRLDAAIRAVEVPPAMADRVPSTLSLEAVGADGLRLALERGYLPANWTEDARGRVADRAGQALAAAFGDDVPLDVRLDETTLQGGVRGDPDAEPPLAIHATAEAERTFAAFGSSRQAAIVLTSVDQEVPLDAFPPFETRYEILAPEGATLEDARLDGGRGLQQTRIDGRDAIVVDVGPQDEGAAATMSLGVTPGLLLGASPMIAVAVLVASAAVVLVVVKVVVGRDGGDPEGGG